MPVFTGTFMICCINATIRLESTLAAFRKRAEGNVAYQNEAELTRATKQGLELALGVRVFAGMSLFVPLSAKDRFQYGAVNPMDTVSDQQVSKYWAGGRARIPENIVSGAGTYFKET